MSRKPSLREALAPVLARRGDPAQIERRRRALGIGLQSEPGEDDLLAAELVIALEDGTPRTVTEIARLVGRRRSAVDRMLVTDARFLRVPAPRSRSRRAKTFTLTMRGEGQVGTSRFGDVGEAA